ncbi:hypothetical protein A0U40_13365 [[Bacillus] sp. KCTC 13219]|nr:hypothetical protein A0U40_13365 [[Bacillus] sp. KCTC 13219]
MSEIICRHCGSTDGFYTRAKVSGIIQTYFNSIGDFSITRNTEMYNNLEHREMKTAYCTSCEKAIGKGADLITGNEEGEN